MAAKAVNPLPIPTDCFNIALQFCDEGALCTLSSVCKNFEVLAKHDQLWKNLLAKREIVFITPVFRGTFKKRVQRVYVRFVSEIKTCCPETKLLQADLDKMIDTVKEEDRHLFYDKLNAAIRNDPDLITLWFKLGVTPGCISLHATRRKTYNRVDPEKTVEYLEILIPLFLRAIDNIPDPKPRDARLFYFDRCFDRYADALRQQPCLPRPRFSSF